MIRGSCYCGAVAFELSDQPSMMGTCHCSRCRKAGSSTFVFVKAEHFCWVRGEDNVQRFQPTPPFTYGRAFCKTCGTALGEPGAGESFPISAHALDDDPGVRNRFHEFVAEKPAWYDIADDAKQFPEHPTKD